VASRSAIQATRLTALFAGLAALMLFSSPTNTSVAIGAMAAVPGEALRLWASGHLRKTEELITSGPYAYTRNPLYLGRLMLLTGVCVAAWLPWPGTPLTLAAAWTIFFAIYMRRKERVEPQRLLLRHGCRYEAYRRDVPSLFPRLSRWPDADDGRWRLERFRDNREAFTAVGLLLLLLLLAIRAT
jgi:protein-S-isoprenylcysteine O-methyltransferase Ste14